MWLTIPKFVLTFFPKHDHNRDSADISLKSAQKKFDSRVIVHLDLKVHERLS